jgi:hypothetical protein
VYILVREAAKFSIKGEAAGKRSASGVVGATVSEAKLPLFLYTKTAEQEENNEKNNNIHS